jgi:hypothetical protein
MEKYKIALAQYISVLGTSMSNTNWTEDRVKYQKHLAEAALMFAVIQKDDSVQKLKDLVAAERHNYGWDYLHGSLGNTAESAFDIFAKLVESS